MLLRFSFLLLLYALLSDKIDSLIPTQSCADIIRPSQTYTPADSSLTIGTISTFSYQECGKQCRVTTLCRTAVWCQGQCTMYQEYIAFGIRSPDLTCMLITLSGIAFNEIEPVITIVKNIAYKESQSKYYEQTYTVDSLDECTQLCRLDSHCLTASYQSDTSSCALFAEHVSQGHNYTNPGWTTIILDTCAGRDSRIYSCLIDATQADRTLCDLLSRTPPIKLDVPEMLSKPNGYTGWLTKTSVYWPMTINGEGAIFRASYDIKIIDPLLFGYEHQEINGQYFHIHIHQRMQRPVFYINSKSSTSHTIHHTRLREQKVSAKDFLNHLKMGHRCRWCYFTIDESTNHIYMSMDNSNSIDRYENNGQNKISIYLPSPLGIIIRNHDLWIVNSSQLIILSPRRLSDHTLTYLIKNQIDLSSLYNLPITNPLNYRDYSIYMPFHLDVDNYGRLYITGALLNLWFANEFYSPGNNSQLYILTDSEQAVPSVVCAGPWGMYGVNVYHSKLKLRMLTSTSDFFFNLYSNP